MQYLEYSSQREMEDTYVLSPVAPTTCFSLFLIHGISDHIGRVSVVVQLRWVLSPFPLMLHLSLNLIAPL